VIYNSIGPSFETSLIPKMLDRIDY